MTAVTSGRDRCHLSSKLRPQALSVSSQELSETTQIRKTTNPPANKRVSNRGFERHIRCLKTVGVNVRSGGLRSVALDHNRIVSK